MEKLQITSPRFIEQINAFEECGTVYELNSWITGIETKKTDYTWYQWHKNNVSLWDWRVNINKGYRLSMSLGDVYQNFNEVRFIQNCGMIDTGKLNVCKPVNAFEPRPVSRRCQWTDVDYACEFWDQLYNHRYVIMEPTF